MTDRELLELAAKAAGIALADWNDGAEPYSSGIGFVLPSNRMWNPLTDDGDALRLAVKLNLLGGCDDPYQIATASMVDGCPYAATRRAIVRAAAEIGKGMQ